MTAKPGIKYRNSPGRPLSRVYHGRQESNESNRKTEETGENQKAAKAQGHKINSLCVFASWRLCVIWILYDSSCRVALLERHNSQHDQDAERRRQRARDHEPGLEPDVREVNAEDASFPRRAAPKNEQGRKENVDPDGENEETEREMRHENLPMTFPTNAPGANARFNPTAEDEANFIR